MNVVLGIPDGNERGKSPMGEGTVSEDRQPTDIWAWLVKVKQSFWKNQESKESLFRKL